MFMALVTHKFYEHKDLQNKFLNALIFLIIIVWYVFSCKFCGTGTEC